MRPVFLIERVVVVARDVHRERVRAVKGVTKRTRRVRGEDGTLHMDILGCVEIFPIWLAQLVVLRGQKHAVPRVPTSILSTSGPMDPFNIVHTRVQADLSTIRLPKQAANDISHIAQGHCGLFSR